MRLKNIALCVALIACAALNIHAQQTGAAATGTAQATKEQRVPLTEQSIALDSTGREALAARLRTTALNGTLDAPLKNVRIVVENRSADFYTYVSGWTTFYDAAGVRCGEGMFKLDAFAPAESAETDTPGLRLTCTPATWRIVALNLLTRTSDTAKPLEPIPPQEQTAPAPVTAMPTTPLFINITVDGQSYRVPLGSTLEIPVNKKPTKISVSASQQ